MNRLTEQDDLGNWCVKGIKWEDLREGKVITREIYEKIYGCLFKLKEYESTGLSPEDIEQIDRQFLEKCQEVNSFKLVEGTTYYGKTLYIKQEQ